MANVSEKIVYVDSATHGLIKVEAARRNITMGDLVSDLLGRYLHEENER